MSNITIGFVCWAICLCVFVILSFVMFQQMDFKNPKPLPELVENQRLFRALVNLGPGQAADVQIRRSGKYLMKSDNFSFSYTIRWISLQGYKNALAKANTDVKRENPVKWKGYFKVRSVAEELSKAMSNFLSLAYVMSPGKAQMKLVAPHFGGGAMGAGGDPFDVFFDLEHLNRILSNSNYSILVKDEEYNRACKGEMIYVIQEFFSKKRMKKGYLSEEGYRKLMGENGGKNWMECDRAPAKSINTKYICTKHFNIPKLRQTVLKNATCVEIYVWVDHGLAKVNMGAGRLNTALIFRWLAKPSDMLIEEARTFVDLSLERPYVAIHIRSAHISREPSTVRRCFSLAVEFVKALKSTRNVKSVFLSTDMSKYGSVAAKKNIENELAAMVGAVIYDPKATGKLKVIAKSTVSITDVLLMSQSDHLITLADGNFHGFVVDRFLLHHLNIDPNTWSLTEICKRTR